MNFLDALMYVFQYSYYRMIKWDEGLQKAMSTSGIVSTKIKTLSVFGIAELCMVAAVYFFLNHQILARPAPLAFSYVFLGVCGLVMTFLNQLILGSEDRTKHYRQIFEKWDKKKQRRWSLYVSLILVLSLVACAHEMEEDMKMRSTGSPT
jgi:polyferredoxin